MPLPNEFKFRLQPDGSIYQATKVRLENGLQAFKVDWGYNGHQYSETRSIEYCEYSVKVGWWLVEPEDEKKEIKVDVISIHEVASYLASKYNVSLQEKLDEVHNGLAELEEMVENKHEEHQVVNKDWFMEFDAYLGRVNIYLTTNSHKPVYIPLEQYWEQIK